MIKFLLTGHVDHGKSTLGGQILYQCDSFDKRSAEKIFTQAEKEKMNCFRWARLLDIDCEEQEKGVTIESNEFKFQYQEKDFKLIDTPGHKLYIRHLINAIYCNSEDGVLVGVLVLSAIPREYQASVVSGQIKEDILLLRAAGIDSVVVAINKMDKLNWDRNSFDKIQASITPLLKSARYRQIMFAACSGLEGKGVLTKEFEDVPALLESIEKCSLNKKIILDTPKCEIKETNLISVDIFILNCSIFSPGYEGIIHMTQGEFGFKVEKITRISPIKTSKPPPFIKTGEGGKAILLLSEKITIKNKDRLILRRCDKTIAHGIVSI